MWKKYVAMGVASVLLLTNVPNTVYAAEVVSIPEEQSEGNILESTAEEPSNEELNKLENKDIQERVMSGDEEPYEETTDNSEILASEEDFNGEENQEQKNQEQEDEEVYYEEQEIDMANDDEQEDGEIDIEQGEAYQKEVLSLENVPEEQSDSLDGQSEEAEYLPYEGAKYRLKYKVEENGIAITGIKPDAWGIDFGQLVIPTEIEGKQVIKISEGAFSYCTFSGDLVIPGSISIIEGVAFYCSTFTGKLVISEGVNEIGEKAFAGCVDFVGDLVIPKSVTTIGNSAFYSCSFTNLIIAMENVPKRAFNYCSVTGNLILKEGVSTIEEYAFYYTDDFTGNLVMSDSITFIGESAFEGKGFTGTLNIPKSRITIGDSAFYHCSGFTGHLIIPGSVAHIGKAAFGSCDGLTGNLVLSEGITTIWNGAFYDCKGLTGSLVIPKSVTTIEENAFAFCAGLAGDLVIPETVTTIGSGAFVGCNGFTGDLVISETVTSIGANAFSRLDNLIINMKNIPEKAFDKCTFTGSVKLGDNVVEIEKEAFANCKIAGDLVIPRSVIGIGEDAFNEAVFNHLTIDMENIPKAAFSGCVITGTLTFQEGVTTIGERAFCDCRIAGELTLQEGITNIGERAFANCGVFSSDLVIPSSVINIEDNAFASSGFENLRIHVRNIPDNFCAMIYDGTNYMFRSSSPFYACAIRGKIILEEGIVSIGEHAFSYCNLIDIDLVLPEGVTHIGRWAFENSKAISSLKIPDSVEMVGSCAFADCDNLRNIEIAAGVGEIGERAFDTSDMPIFITFWGMDTVISKYTIAGWSFIYGHKGSTAEKYANRNRKSAFVPLETPEFIEYRVTTSQELLDAIGSYRCITLADGIYEIPDLLDLGNIVYTTIKAENPGKVEILSKSTTVPVVSIGASMGLEIYGCILGHESIEDTSHECGVSEAKVVSCGGSLDIKISSCDLYGCGIEGGGFTDCINVNVDNCIIRDCMRRIASLTYAENVNFTNCIISGNAYDEGLAKECGALDLMGADVSFQDCLFINNHNTQFEDNYYYWESDLDLGNKLQTEDCIFYNNAWDGDEQGTYGICLNGITWQLDGDILKIGYPIQLGDTLIQSEKGAVLSYSDSSLPWKKCSYQKVDVAEGVKYDRREGIKVNTSGIDMEVKVPVTGEEYEKLLTNILTPEEMQAIEKGEKAETEIIVTDGNAALSERDRQAIENAAMDTGYAIGKYLDISMQVQVGDGSKRMVSNTKVPVRMVLGIPEELYKDKREYSLIRMHNGEITLLEDLGGNSSTVTFETDCFSTYVLVYRAMEGISGKVSSFGEENKVVQLQLVDSNGVTVTETQVTGGKTLYMLEEVPMGSYTLRVTKDRHVTRNYPVTIADGATQQNVELWLIGDVNGDGKVNAKDKKILYNHIAGSNLLADYAFAVGDVNGDGRVNAKDKKMIYNHIAGITLLWD